MNSSTERGFTLIEALMAVAILGSGLGGLMSLASMSARANQAAAMNTLATILATEQLERLSSQFSAAGLASTPLSPGDALSVDHAGFSDFFDARGRWVSAGPSPPTGAAFVRRWSIDVLPGGPAQSRLARVVVLRWPEASGLTGEEVRRSELIRLLLIESGP